MSAAATNRSRPPTQALLEYAVSAPAGSFLKVDRQAGVIFGVKVLGRYSKNRYDPAAENGIEYSPACMEDAVRRQLYEGCHVNEDHPRDRSRPGLERDAADGLGVLRNARVETGRDGEPGIYADFHYLRAKALCESVCEDVERGLGVFGLSHNASAAKERFDRQNRRVVVESLALVRGVDLVRKPATNKNLWESERPMPITMRSLLESRRVGLSKPRRKWLDRLVEMYEEDAPMAAEVEPAADVSPDDQLAAGFRAAILAIIDGDGTAAEKAKKIGEYLKTHERLTQEPEPEDVEESEDDATKKKGDEKSADKTESLAELAELATLRAEKAARNLCESMQFEPTAIQVDALAAIPEAKRKAIVESFKAARPAAGGKPRSVPAGGPSKTGGKDRLEDQKPDPAASRAALYG